MDPTFHNNQESLEIWRRDVYPVEATYCIIPTPLSFVLVMWSLIYCMSYIYETMIYRHHFEFLLKILNTSFCWRHVQGNDVLSPFTFAMEYYKCLEQVLYVPITLLNYCCFKSLEKW
jgi:hypothetical protein